jgi:hypothetical protein
MRCAEVLYQQTHRQQLRWQTFLQATTSLSPSASPSSSVAASDPFMILAALGLPCHGAPGAQVLIVEDDKELRELLRFAL